MDIDIDVANRNDVLRHLKHRKATLTNGKVHNTGVYFNEIPYDPVTNQASIDYNEASNRGYFKFDILNVNIYNKVRDKQHLDRLVNQEPMWELLEYKDFVDNLFHLSGHDDLLKKTKPKSLKQLAAVLCMIRPAKRYLCDKSWDDIFEKVWVKPDTNDYYFKKAHSFSYAMAVMVHMNLIIEELDES